MLNILWFVLGWLTDEEFEKYLAENLGLEPMTLDDFYTYHFQYWGEEDSLNEDVMYVLNLIDGRINNNVDTPTKS